MSRFEKLMELGLGPPPTDPYAHNRYWDRRLARIVLVAVGAQVAAFILSVGLLAFAVALSGP